MDQGFEMKTLCQYLGQSELDDRIAVDDVLDVGLIHHGVLRSLPADRVLPPLPVEDEVVEDGAR